MTTNIQTFAGNVGIGTNDPGSFKLNVNGTVSATSLTVNGITNSEVPSGLIAMWSGATNDPPDGWVFCDGTNGTPNLKNRFILGASGDSPTTPNPGQTGGQHSLTLLEGNLPAHAHVITVDIGGSHDHGEQTGGAGSHSHGVYSSYNGYRMGTYGPNQNVTGSFSGYRLDIAYAPYRTNTLGSAIYANNVGNHQHSIPNHDGHQHTASAAQTGSGQAFDNRPSYYVLAYIMKI